MEIYFILFTIAFLLSFSGRHVQRGVMWLFIIALFIIGSFRSYSVGGDNIVYELNFRYTVMNPSSWSPYTEFEPGFSFLMAIFKHFISVDYLFFMGCVFFSYMLSVVYFFKKQSKNFTVSIFIFLGLLFYTDAFNIMRQYFALGFALVAFTKFQENKKIVPYVVFVLADAFLLHKTLVILCVLPFLSYERMQKFILDEKKVVVLCIVSWLCVANTQFLFTMIPYMEQYISFLGTRYVGYLWSSIDKNVTYSLYLSLINTSFFLLAMKLTPRKNRDVYFSIALLSIVVTNFFGAISNLFLRVGTNLSIFQTVYYANLFNTAHHKYVYRFFLVIYLLIVFTNSIVKGYGAIVPYSMWIL